VVNIARWKDRLLKLCEKHWSLKRLRDMLTPYDYLSSAMRP
jgi:hypothetical protein